MDRIGHIDALQRQCEKQLPVLNRYSTKPPDERGAQRSAFCFFRTTMDGRWRGDGVVKNDFWSMGSCSTDAQRRVCASTTTLRPRLLLKASVLERMERPFFFMEESRTKSGGCD
jgi:hypothetical protein